MRAKICLRTCRAVALSPVVAAIGALAAAAAPLSPEACQTVKKAMAELEAAGVAEDKAKGPEWARLNLDPGRLENIRRWIALEEQSRFQCPQPKPQKAAKEPAEATQSADPPKKAKEPKPRKKPKVDDAYVPPSPSAGPEIQHATPGALGDLRPEAGFGP